MSMRDSPHLTMKFSDFSKKIFSGKTQKKHAYNTGKKDFVKKNRMNFFLCSRKKQKNKKKKNRLQVGRCSQFFFF